MNGVIVVEKPGGVTSFDVVARVRRALGQRRVGHAGTLDPMATGVLPVCVGEATKLVPFLHDGDKVYEAEAHLGVSTDTQDADGKIVAERDASAVTRDAVERALAGFVGTIQQRPPMHSALRVNGRRLYELAREGQEVERQARPVEVHSITLDAFAAPRIRFTVRCGKGTYIRTLAHDLGEALGVGAHLTGLRRTRVGRFVLADAVGLDQLASARLVPLAEALAELPSLPLDDGQARAVRDGKLAAIAQLTGPPSGRARLLRPDGTLLAVAESTGGRLRLLRVFG
jgi:tRNA pseudouridine55 synthase